MKLNLIKYFSDNLTNMQVNKQAAPNPHEEINLVALYKDSLIYYPRVLTGVAASETALANFFRLEPEANIFCGPCSFFVNATVKISFR